MEIYLRHPVHGVKIASLEAEAEYDEINGWTRFVPGAPNPPAATVAENVKPDDYTAVINSMPPRRRGRPPINREL